MIVYGARVVSKHPRWFASARASHVPTSSLDSEGRILHSVTTAGRDFDTEGDVEARRGQATGLRSATRHWASRESLLLAKPPRGGVLSHRLDKNVGSASTTSGGDA